MTHISFVSSPAGAQVIKMGSVTPHPTPTPTPYFTPTPTSPPPQGNTLVVTAEPSYSYIKLDNGAPLQAPRTYYNVSSGTHNLKVAATGYVSYDSNIYISSGGITNKHIVLEKVVPTPFPTVTPPPNNFISDCVSGNTLTCSWSKLESYLLNKTVGGLWWELSETIRRKIVKTAIQNSINKNIPYHMPNGSPNCGGATGTWEDAVCVPNSIIRHLKFGYLPNVGQDDTVCSPERAYYKHSNSGIAHCFYTQNSYHLPICAVSAIVPNGFAHALSSIQVSKDTSKIGSWIVFQYSDVDIQPGHWQMPHGARIRFSVPSRICKNCIYGTRVGEFYI